eukprot:jgi/Botrbrau1/9285/Bobra.0111s0012.1
MAFTFRGLQTRSFWASERIINRHDQRRIYQVTLGPCLKSPLFCTTCGIPNGSSEWDSEDLQERVSDTQVSNLRGKRSRAGIPPSLPTFKTQNDTGSALRRTLSEVSNSDGRIAMGNNLVLGGDGSEEAWRELDKKINEYPDYRVFKGIGEGGESFVKSMVAAVESIVGPVTPDQIREKESSAGRYVSVSVGPVLVSNADQVRDVYMAMKQDKRLKWLI